MSDPIPSPEQPPVLTDEEVVRRVLAGEIALFEVVMRRNNQRVYRAVRSILRNDTEAEDVMQEAYVNAYAHLADFSGRSRLSTWLVRIAVHEAFARLRHRKRITSFDNEEWEAFDMASTHESPEHLTSDRELRALMEEAVDGLPVGFRSVFMLRAVEQLSVTETAEALGIPEETVKTRLHRARGLLKTALTERIGTAVPALFDFHLSRCDRVVSGVLERLRGGS